MRMPKRIDRINSVSKLFLLILCIAVYFVFSELVLNFTVFRGTKNDFEYYANLVLSKEESENAEKFRRDIISLGEERQTSIPGTIIFKYKPAKRESFTFNSDGFRNGEFREKEKDEFRIAIFGDSKIFGFAVQNDGTIPYIVEKNLREHFHKNITVLNMGVEGHDLQREFATAQFYLEKIKPDMVVFYSLIIDVHSAFDVGNDDWKPFEGDEKLIPGIEGNQDTLTIYDKIRLFKTLQHTYFSDMAKLTARIQGSDIAKLPLSPQKEDFAEKFPEVYLNRIKNASAYFEKSGIPSLFIIQPLIHVKNPLSEHEKYMLYLAEVAFPGVNIFYQKCIDGVLDALKTGDYGSNIIDHTKIFQGNQDTVFFDGIHYTPKALKFEADKMSKGMIKFLEEGKYLEKH